MDTRAYINVTDIPVPELCLMAYKLSRPQGLGFLHARPDRDETPEEVFGDLLKPTQRGSYHFDYVRGRAMKFNIYEHEGQRYIQDRWYDHSEQDLLVLLAVFMPAEEALRRVEAAKAGRAEVNREYDERREAAGLNLVARAVDGEISGKVDDDEWYDGRSWLLEKGLAEWVGPGHIRLLPK